MLVQETLKKDPFCGHLFAFRGKRAQIVKVLFWDGNGLCLFTKRLDRGGFVWPRMTGYEGSITLSPAQLAIALRKWRDRLDEREVEIDRRAHLHLSARPVVGTPPVSS